MKISLDTNVLIDSPEIVFDKTREFVISFKVIQELDNLKRNPDLKRAAQSALKNIRYQVRQKKIEILNMPTELGDSPDEIIIQDTKDANASFLTGDFGAELIADAAGVEISGFEAEEDINFDYTGIVRVKGDLMYEQDFVQIKEMQLQEFNEMFSTDLKENQYCIIDRVIDKNDIWVNTSYFCEEKQETQHTVKRISQSLKPFKDAGIMIAPLDSEQWCALDAVFNPDIPLTIIDGKLGTGKTILTLMGVLACSIGQKRFQVYDQILVTKPPVSTNKGLYTGFKPGTREEKMSGHLSGITSNLKFLLDEKNNKKKELKPGEEIPESKSEEVWRTNFDVIEIDEMQGFSANEGTCVIVDEWQLLDEEGAKMVISRIATGAKLILVGDTHGQTYGMNRANEGFKVVYNYLGKAPEFNYIKLETIYRSKLAKLVAEMFES